MQKYTTNGSLPTNQNNYNAIINNNFGGYNNMNYINRRKVRQNVKFNQNVEIYDIESYKELNKLLTYDEEEGIKELLKEDPNIKLYGDYRKHDNNSNTNTSTRTSSNYNPFGNFRNPNATRRRVDPKCCCILL